MNGATFHTADLHDVEVMIDWAVQEGWNPGLDDAAAFFETDPEGFFIARVDGVLAAAISVVNHDETMAFLGLYLCQPEFRGQGLAFALWQHALKHAGNRCVGLDGVAAQESNYAKSGFVRHGAITRFAGTVPCSDTPFTRPIELMKDFDAIERLDIAANGYRRARFLSHWIVDCVASRKTVIAELNGNITGFATARLCRRGAKIGPIVAPDTDTAVALLTAAASVVGTHEVSVDVADTQTDFRSALTSSGFTPIFETAHMYRGKPPKSPLLGYAVATMECG